jgi:hypothetical protein
VQWESLNFLFLTYVLSEVKYVIQIPKSPETPLVCEVSSKYGTVGMLKKSPRTSSLTLCLVSSKLHASQFLLFTHSGGSDAGITWLSGPMIAWAQPHVKDVIEGAYWGGVTIGTFQERGCDES